MTQSNDKNHERPVRVFEEGRVQAAVWQRGEAPEPSYYVNVSKSYRGSDGQWKKCSTFSMPELKDLDKCVERARKWIHERQVTAQVDKPDRQHRSERDRERGDRPRARDEQPSQSQSGTKVRMDDLVDAIAKRLEQRINRQR
ncbi:MAG: hypothetical protein U0790_04040 [Isosphaeraceae bacterium]